MTMRVKLVLYMIVTVILSTASFGQKTGRKIRITGSVVDGTEASIANAIIMIDGEKTEFVTDRKGLYKIRVSSDNTKIGVFTFTNGILEEPLYGRSVINFKFEGSVPDQAGDDTDPGEEVIDMGITTVKKKTVTGSVGKIDGRQSKYASYNTIYDMIRGEIPGVQVNGTSILIRGVSSIMGSNEPLFVVDGVPVNTIDNIQPQMVRSIQVLKGSAASIYGVRGSNGVIVINLLSGKDR
jgi:TonB-dependent SusC/RagA subfamily outer membrane receptor